MSLWDHPDVVRVPAEVLREVSEVVDPLDKEAQRLAKRLVNLVHLDPGAAGLAANQIGVAKRVIAVRRQSGQVLAMLNPVIQPYLSGELEKGVEGCFSLPGVKMEVERPSTCAVVYHNLKGHSRAMGLLGYDARVVQHEVDHLNGVLITDKGREVESE